MSTEDLDPHFVDLDQWTSLEAVTAMIEGQFGAISAVQQAAASISKAVDDGELRLRDSAGRLVYAGAGTSGRIAVQDGVELLPTYNWPWERLVFGVAGGEAALMRAVENAEDDQDAGRAFVANESGLMTWSSVSRPVVKHLTLSPFLKPHARRAH